MRRRVRASRRARDPRDVAHDGTRLAAVVADMPEVRRARCVTLYAAMPGEPDTGPLRALLASRGIRVLLPIVLPDRRLDWADDSGELVAHDGLGGQEPTGPRLGEDAARLADVLLVPGLAVDTLGYRLGQGAGYYDGVLSSVDPRLPVVVLLNDDEVLDAAVEPVPTEAHDRPVTAVATPTRCLRLR